MSEPNIDPDIEQVVEQEVVESQEQQQADIAEPQQMEEQPEQDQLESQEVAQAREDGVDGEVQPPEEEQLPEPVVIEEDEETKRLRLEREEIEKKEREEIEERERIVREEVEAKLQEDQSKFAEMLRAGISQLGKVANGSTYAYLKMNLAEKEIEKLFQTICNYEHIRYLDLSQNKISDISQIQTLKYLVQLNASRNEISSLQCFKESNSFPYLQFLNMSGNKLVKLEPIQLPKLRRLNLSENEITSCDEFVGHPNIEILEMRKNKLKNTNGIALMPQLQELYLAENEITDFRSLIGLPKLLRLNLRKNNITKIKTPVPELPSLEHINLRENLLAKYDDFTKLARIKNIISINMLANPIVDEMADGFKTEILMFYHYFAKINKQEITLEDLCSFEYILLAEASKALEERILEDERKRVEQEEALKLAQEEALLIKQQEAEAAQLILDSQEPPVEQKEEIAANPVEDEAPPIEEPKDVQEEQVEQEEQEQQEEDPQVEQDEDPQE